MKTAIITGSLVFGFLWLGCRADPPAKDAPPTVDPPVAEEQETTTRTLHFTYSVRIPPAPPGAERLEVWIPLPLEDPGVQEVAELETSVNGDDLAGMRTVDQVHGNSMFYVQLDAPQEETLVEWSARITRHVDSGQGRLPVRPCYLEPNRLVPVNGPARQLAEKLGVENPEAAPEGRARRIFDDVLVSMEYDKSVPGYGTGDFLRAITVCKGNCTDFHARFIGTARAARIPCRFTMGIPLSEESTGTYNSYHCWAHWHEDGRWQPVDISEADKIEESRPEAARRYFGRLDPHRVALTLGRDIVLAPPQAGEPLNYFVFPYVEVDGKPVELDKSHWEFAWRDV